MPAPPPPVPTPKQHIAAAWATPARSCPATGPANPVRLCLSCSHIVSDPLQSNRTGRRQGTCRPAVIIASSIRGRCVTKYLRGHQIHTG